MAATLFDAIIRHQIYVEGLKRGQGVNLAQTLLKLNTDVKAEFARIDYANLGDMSKVALNEFVGRLKLLADKVFNAWLNDLIAWLERYMQVERELLPKVFGITTDKSEADFDDAKDGAGLWGIARNAPIAGVGVLILPFLAGYAASSSMRLVQIAQAGYANRATPAEALAAMIGAPAADRAPRAAPPGDGGGSGRGPAPVLPFPTANGGALGLLQRNGQAVTNTVLQHAAAQASFGISKVAFAEYLWVSVLDDATTRICRDRNGNVYRYGEGPLPPAHVGCRSSTVPFDGSAPVTMPSFTMWANGQPREFVNDAFDRTPGSEYEGASAVSLEQFAGKLGLITA